MVSEVVGMNQPCPLTVANLRVKFLFRWGYRLYLTSGKPESEMPVKGVASVKERMTCALEPELKRVRPVAGTRGTQGRGL